MRNVIVTVSSIFLLMSLFGCLEKEKDVSNNSSGAKNEVAQPVSEQKKDVVIFSATLENNTFIILGSNLEKVTNLTIKQNSTHTFLSIESKSKDKITAKAKSSLALAAGVIYRLAIGTAKAETEIPITISVTLPNLAVNATCTNTASERLSFVGYSASTNANLGGLKGGNAICESLYPGSHWASMDEIMSLGAKYPWTDSVWIRDLGLLTDPNKTLSSYCDMFKTSSSNSWCGENSEATVGAGNGNAPTLSQNGGMKYVCCNALRKLACVK
jgi:hypothetical protein